MNEAVDYSWTDVPFLHPAARLPYFDMQKVREGGKRNRKRAEVLGAETAYAGRDVGSLASKMGSSQHLSTVQKLPRGMDLTKPCKPLLLLLSLCGAACIDLCLRSSCPC